MSEWRQAPAVQRLFEVLNPDGEETRCVGGAVRNALCNETPCDVDFATTLLPDQTVAILERNGITALPIGIEHGTVRAILYGKSYEITTLREDVETDGRHAKVRFTRGWAVDAARRDFTINALSMDRSGQIYDYFDGRSDLERQRVRFIGSASARIQEDYLRILRFFRFSALYGGGTVDMEGLRACFEHSGGLQKLSRERVTQEFEKILSVAHPLPILRLMGCVSGLCKSIFGFDPDFGGLERLLETERALGKPANFLVRLASIKTGELFPTLRLSGKDRAALGHFSRALAPCVSNEDRRFQLFELAQKGLGHVAEGALLLREAHENAHRFVEDHALLKRFETAAFPLGGADLLKAGFEPGPTMGKTLSEVQKWWISQNMEPTKEACLAFCQTVASS